MLLFSRQRGRLGRPNTKRQTDEQIRRSKIHVLSLKVSDWIGGQWSLDSRIEIIKPTLLYSIASVEMMTTNCTRSRKQDPTSPVSLGTGSSSLFQDSPRPTLLAMRKITYIKVYILWSCELVLSFFLSFGPMKSTSTVTFIMTNMSDSRSVDHNVSRYYCCKWR